MTLVFIDKINKSYKNSEKILDKNTNYLKSNVLYI